MGKRKYQAVRLASSMKSSDAKRGGKTAIKFMPNCPIPKLLTYNSLVNEIKKIDVAKVYSIEEEFIDDEYINGCFRNLREYLPRLAKFLFYMQGKRKGALKWFGETEGSFLVAFGGMDALLVKTNLLVHSLSAFLMLEREWHPAVTIFSLWG